MDRVDPTFPYIFIFEGPIDAMFVKNGVSSAGLSLTEAQKQQLLEFPFHEKIWVLDNPRFDDAASKKIKELILDRQKVFKWPSSMSYKDFNEMAMFEEIDSIEPKTIIDNLY
jgi:hypothetical protein